MSKRHSTWAQLAAALAASLLYGTALAGSPEEGAAACDSGDCRKAYDLRWPLADRKEAGTQPGPGLARGDVEAVKAYHPAVNSEGGADDEIKVHTARTADGEAIQVVVALAVPVDPDVVRAVLTDYENMPRFVPDILAARLISSKNGRKRVKIEGVARLLFMDIPTNATLDVVDQPDGAIAIDSVAGNLAIHGVVRVHRDGPYTRVDYQVRIAPDFWLPPLIGDFLIGRQIKRQFEGMVEEMHRRADGHQMRAHVPDGLRLGAETEGLPIRSRRPGSVSLA